MNRTAAYMVRAIVLRRRCWRPLGGTHRRHIDPPPNRRYRCPFPTCEVDMRSRTVLFPTLAGVGLFIASIAGLSGFDLQQTAGATVPADPDDLAGTVSGPKGPEAGVWVIAETRELGTPFARTVVTDDAGRYLLPDLPPATYDVWVRGYGLVDSPKTKSKPGQQLNL